MFNWYVLETTVPTVSRPFLRQTTVRIVTVHDSLCPLLKEKSSIQRPDHAKKIDKKNNQYINR